MSSSTKAAIYYDPNAVTNHNRNAMCMECGARVDVGPVIAKYANKFYVVQPQYKIEYFNMLKELHGNNPILNYLTSKPFTRNWFQKIFGMKPKGFKVRNCNGCSMETTDNVCETCRTVYDRESFFKYAHNVDHNISDSDTTYITHTTLMAIKNATSLVCQMIDAMEKGLIHYAFAIIRPPGHHASHSKSEGFCIINNIAVCANYALRKGYKKIFIFDFDAHHGNGTQNIFYDRDDVYYCSMHTIDAYPRTGEENEIGNGAGLNHNLNILVKKGVETIEYLELFDERVLPALKNYEPDLILVSAGFDGLESDQMKVMKLSVNCYAEIVESFVATGLPIGLLLEGGYNLAELPDCFDACLSKFL